MTRRLLLPTGLSFFLVLASVLWLSGASITSAWNPSGTAPKPVVSADEPAPPGGIGNKRADLEHVYGVPTGLAGTMVGYENGMVGAGYTKGRATSLLLRFPRDERVGFSAAHDKVQSLLPTDVAFVGTLGAGPNRTAEIYQSDRLAQYVSSPQKGVPAGQLTVVYQTDASGRVSEVLLNVGGLPSSVSR